MREYRETLRAWDRTLQQLARRRFFRDQLSESTWLESLAKTFGPSAVSDEEAGWGPLAPGADVELRYQYYDLRLRESWQARRLTTAFGYWIVKVSSGYGLKPTRLLATFAVATVLFAFAFFANDYWHNGLQSSAHFCRAVQAPMQWYEPIIDYLYLSIASLTSLGADTNLVRYCNGRITESILIASSLVGFYLLANLAALFIQPFARASNGSDAAK